MKQYDKALTEFKKILKQKPDFTESRVNLARVYIDLNQADQSIKELKRAEKDLTYPHKLKLLFSKGLAYHEAGKYKLANKFLKEAFSTPVGKNCFAYLQLGKTELALGNLKSSEDFLKKVSSGLSKRKTCL